MSRERERDTIQWYERDDLLHKNHKMSRERDNIQWYERERRLIT